MIFKFSPNAAQSPDTDFVQVITYSEGARGDYSIDLEGFRRLLESEKLEGRTVSNYLSTARILEQDLSRLAGKGLDETWAEFEDRYLRRIMEQIIKTESGYRAKDIEPYIDDAREKVDREMGEAAT